MSQYICSVVVIQYNPMWEKLKRTLNSIINQQNCSFEIIIADDASKKDYFDEIEQYFHENNVQNYQLIKNKVNGGTVKNVLAGIRAATGKYVRVIAPGDMLYSELTLYKIVNFMEANQAKEAFGRMAFYNEKDGNINVVPKQLPCDLRPYRMQNMKKIKRNMLIFGDNISGASYTWEREYYLECLMRIVGTVTYLEDCASIYTLYDGYEIFFLDEFVTWYEYGSGISTSKNNKWTKILIQDWIEFYKEIEKRYFGDCAIKKVKLYYQMCQKGFLYNKIIKNMLFVRRYIYDRFISKRLSDTRYELIDINYISKMLNDMATDIKP